MKLRPDVTALPSMNRSQKPAPSKFGACHSGRTTALSPAFLPVCLPGLVRKLPPAATLRRVIEEPGALEQSRSVDFVDVIQDG